MSNFVLGSRSLGRMEGVDPRLIEVPKLAIQLTVLDFGIPQDGGVRTAERQNELFKDGKSKADGYNKVSNHQPAEDGLGKALDFYALVNGKPSWEHEHLAIVACAWLQAGSLLGVPLNWGGLWTYKDIINGIPYGWDMAHIELG